MACVSCVHWLPPRHLIEEQKHGKPKQTAGLCDLDQKLCHPYYHCARYEDPNRASRETLGLTEEEIAWLRLNGASPAGHHLITLYEMIRACPGDPGARALFDIAITAWRARRTVKEAAAALKKPADG